jgi:maleylpyruvate isomerase
MKLYGFWRSTATWRVRIALAYKEIPYESLPVHLSRGGGEQHRADFVAINPMRHVPVLVVEDGARSHRIAESLAILEFLEERAPSPPLLPRDAFLRARTRQLALLIASGIQPLQNTKVQRHVRDDLHADAAAWTRHWVGKGLIAFDALARETAGQYCVGDALSFADVCLVPQLSFSRRFEVDLEPFPTLLAIEKRCAELPAFKKAHANNQPDAETMPA